MPFITVGRAEEKDKKPKVAIVMSDLSLYLEPDLACQVATDLLIHADRIEKKEMWEAIKGET